MPTELSQQLYAAIVSEDRSIFLTQTINGQAFDINQPLMMDGFEGDTPLFWAVDLGIDSIVVTLLLKKANPNITIRFPDGRQHTLLDHLCQQNLASENKQSASYRRSLKLLLTNNVDQNQNLHKQQTIFSICAKSKKLTDLLLPLLTKTPAAERLNQVEDIDGQSPLTLTVIHNNHAMQNYLLDHGANPEQQGKLGLRPLISAILMCDMQSLKRLHNAQADFEKSCSLETIKSLSPNTHDHYPYDEITPMICAVLFSSEKVVTYLIDAGVNIHEQKNVSISPLEVAVGYGLMAKATMLFNHIDIQQLSNEQVKTLLRMSFASNSEPMIYHVFRYVHIKELEMRTDELYAMRDTISSESVKENITHYLDRIVTEAEYQSNDVSVKQKLTLAIRNGDVAAVKTWLNKVRNINGNAAGHDHLTFLHYAALLPKPSLEIIATLLERGADPNITIGSRGAEQGLLPTLVSSGNDLKILSILLEHGAQPNLFTAKDQMSALHYAVQANNILAARLLMSYGADANLVSNKSEAELAVTTNLTPLRLAGIKHQPAMLELLLSYERTDPYDTERNEVPLHTFLIATVLKNELINLVSDIEPENKTRQAKLLERQNHQNALACIDALIGRDFNFEKIATFTYNDDEFKDVDCAQLIYTLLMLDNHLIALPKLCPHMPVDRLFDIQQNDSKGGLLALNCAPIILPVISKKYKALDYLFKQRSKDLDLDKPAASLFIGIELRLLDYALVQKDSVLTRMLIHYGAKTSLMSYLKGNMTYKDWIESIDTPEFKGIAQIIGDGREVSYSASEHAANTDTISSHKFSQTLETIKKKVKTRPESPVLTAQTDFFKLPPAKATTWFNGELDCESNRVFAIEGTTTKSYVYLDKTNLARQGCAEEIFKLFADRRKVFKDSHIKQLNGEVTGIDFQITVGDTQYSAKCTHELKISNKKERILLLRVDNQEPPLYVGCIYLSNGLHSQADRDNLKNRSHTIELVFAKQAKTKIIAS